MGHSHQRQTPSATPSRAHAPAVDADDQDLLGNAALLDRLNAGGVEGSADVDDAEAATDNRAKLTVTTTNTTWNAKGSLSDIADEVDRRKAGAHVTWTPSYSVKKDHEKYVTSVDIKVPITKEMPVWVDRGTASAADQKKWDTFEAALELHEQGHIKIARKGFQGVGESMLDMPASTGKQTFDNGVIRVQGESDDYDTKTNHGATQGAVLTP